MRTIDFETQFTYTGHKVVVPVVLVHPRVILKVEMVLDTGAAISVLNRMFISQLGLTVTDGPSIGLKVANGDVAEAFIHPIDINFLGRRMSIEVAICPEWDTANLLGMRGFFDQMVIAFDHANKSVYV